MPVVIGSPNNPNTAFVIMQALKNVMNCDMSSGVPMYNTQLAASSDDGKGTNSIFIQNKEAMMLSMTASNPYATHLSTGPRKFRRASNRTFLGMCNIKLEYGARWDERWDTASDALQPDDILMAIDSDLEIIQANIERNDSLAWGGVNHCISIPEMTVSEYEGMYEKSRDGLTIVKRDIMLSCNLLPYDA